MLRPSSPPETVNQRPQILDRASVVTDFTRCRILAVLDGRELAVGELCSVLQLPQSTVSRHLRVLTESDWVASRREGTSHYYRRRKTEPADATASLWSLLRGETEGDPVLRNDRRRLEGVLRERRLRSEEFFASTAGEWDRLREELFGRTSDLQALLALLDPQWIVGDLGCGTGRLAAALAPFVGRIVAIDASPDMLAAARERLRGVGNVETQSGELEALPLPDASLDLALIVLSLHHAPHPDRILAEAFRVLRPGARVLVVDIYPHDREEYRQRMGHQWLGFDPEELGRTLREAGFARPRAVALPPDPEATGPSLFALTATRPPSP